MDTIDLNTLIRFAEACRRGAESLPKQPRSIDFSDFPAGACGASANLVGRLLKEHFGIDGDYVCGEHHPGLSRNQSHAWFEACGHIIDITHDQFGETNTEGWVLPLDNPWHASFGDIERRKGFCMPQNWPMYPSDGYAAMSAALRNLQDPE